MMKSIHYNHIHELKAFIQTQIFTKLEKENKLKYKTDINLNCHLTFFFVLLIQRDIYTERNHLMK